MMQDTQVILQKIAKGDMQAFEMFYKKYHYRLFMYARKFIADDEAIRDILQEFFTDFWENRRKFDIHTTPEGYIFRSIHNRCIDYIRKSTIRNDFTDLADVRLNEIKARYFFTENGPLNTVFSEDIEAIVDKVIADLPEQCRRVFLMSRKEGISTREIAEAMSLSPRTVESHVYRVLKILKTNLSDYLALSLGGWIFFHF